MEIPSIVIIGDESHAIIGDESHAIIGDESHAIIGDESHAIIGDESHAIIGDESHAIIGDESHAGTYILRIHLKADIALRFGRFKKGKLISLPAGEYAYVGSALAEKGATTLARRLVRHATRSGEQRPHPIRETMLRRFAECGLGNGNLLPRRGKTLHWNVDFLLDLPSAELVGFIAIRSRERLEDRLAKQLEEDPHTGVIERGLGANDVPGNTHLLHVSATEAWWASLPDPLTSMAEGNL